MDNAIVGFIICILLMIFLGGVDFGGKMFTTAEYMTAFRILKDM